MTEELEWRRGQMSFDRGVVEIIGVLTNHLADRGVVDRESLCATLEEHIAVWLAPTPDCPGARDLRFRRHWRGARFFRDTITRRTIII